MIRRCGWCKSIMGETADCKDGEIHGICLSCLFRYFPTEAAKIIGGEDGKQGCLAGP